MTRRISASLMLALAVAMTATLPAQSVPDDPKAFWERMIAAKGGRARLHAIESLVMHADGREARRSDPWRPLGEVHETEVYQLPDRFWAWADTRPSRPNAFSVTMWNGQSRLSWFALAGGAAKKSQYRLNQNTNDDILAQAQVMYLLETRFIRPTPLTVERDRSGKTAVLRATAPGFATILYTVDLGTFLVREVSVTFPLTGTMPDGRPFAPESPPFVLSFERYQTVEGLQMPMRYTDSHRLRWQFNPKLDPALFETAPDGVTSRDWWKKYLKK